MPTKRATEPKRGRGRPPHAPTPALRRRVSIAAGGGMRHEDIALALGINRDTLAKYYEQELSVGAMERRAEVMQALHAAAKRGSSSAAKAYLLLEPQLAAPPLPDGVSPQPEAPGPAPAPEPRQARVGKKEQQKADAVTAQQGTDWESLLPGAPLQ